MYGLIRRNSKEYLRWR